MTFWKPYGVASSVINPSRRGFCFIACSRVRHHNSCLLCLRVGSAWPFSRGGEASSAAIHPAPQNATCAMLRTFRPELMDCCSLWWFGICSISRPWCPPWCYAPCEIWTWLETWLKDRLLPMPAIRKSRTISQRTGMCGESAFSRQLEVW